MNRKIFVGVAVAALAAILGGILLLGPTMVVGSQNESPKTQNIIQVDPLKIELEDI